jgi:hypothetical protein
MLLEIIYSIFPKIKMIIIAIPKSASTSLQKTLSKLHGFKFPLKTINEKDIRRNLKKIISDRNFLYKGHIFPSKKNKKILKDCKKVVLLRNPLDCIKALQRGKKAFIHREDSHNNLDSDFFNGFYNGWINESDEKTKIIKYEELISNPKRVINKIESFFDLPKSKKVKLSKAKYSRSTALTLLRMIYFKLSKIKYIPEIKKRFFPKITR